MPPPLAKPAYSSFLGRGWSFPPQFVREAGAAGRGEVRMTADEEDVAASLRILFSTTEGERFLVPRYGLNLRDQLFEPLGTTARTYLEDRIRTAVLVYEPRINLQALALDTSAENEGVIRIVLDYVIRSTNSRYNLVYPFYKHDANELRGSAALPAVRSAAPAA